MMVEELKLTCVDGVLHVPVRVKPRASRTRVLGFKQGAVEVAVAAPPVDGAANLELLRALSRCLGVPRSRLSLLSGKTGRNKRVLVQGLSAERCRALLSGSS